MKILDQIIIFANNIPSPHFLLSYLNWMLLKTAWSSEIPSWISLIAILSSESGKFLAKVFWGEESFNNLSSSSAIALCSKSMWRLSCISKSLDNLFSSSAIFLFAVFKLILSAIRNDATSLVPVCIIKYIKCLNPIYSVNLSLEFIYPWWIHQFSAFSDDEI